MAQHATPHDQHHLPALLRLAEVRKLTGLSSSSVYRMAKMGTLPRPLKISSRSSAWVESEIRGWIASRIAERDATPARAAGAAIRCETTPLTPARANVSVVRCSPRCDSDP
ncbi:MAG: AlpA family transcriptional regulator [Gammaproteobacteria bacterium]|nr:AlpA family transcriptional regulator [Gammaproteobacteria bacterium]